jgi:hypothetical protein
MFQLPLRTAAAPSSRSPHLQQRQCPPAPAPVIYRNNNAARAACINIAIAIAIATATAIAITAVSSGVMHGNHCSHASRHLQRAHVLERAPLQKNKLAAAR